MYEKIEVEKSKVSSNTKRNKEITSKYLVAFIGVIVLLVVATFLLIYEMDKYNLEYDTILIISSLLLFVVLGTIFIIPKLIENKINSIIFKLLNNRYGTTNRIKKPSPKVVEGKKQKLIIYVTRIHFLIK